MLSMQRVGLRRRSVGLSVDVGPRFADRSEAGLFCGFRGRRHLRAAHIEFETAGLVRPERDARQRRTSARSSAWRGVYIN